MQPIYEAPELTLIGGADEVVLGTPLGSGDYLNMNASLDFEFEQD